MEGIVPDNSGGGRGNGQNDKVLMPTDVVGTGEGESCGVESSVVTPHSETPAQHGDENEAPSSVPTGGRNNLMNDLASREGKEFINTRVAKSFEGDVFLGTITEYFSEAEAGGKAYWHVKYDDGDEEDFDIEEIADSLLLHREFEAKGLGRKTKPGASASKEAKKKQCKVEGCEKLQQSGNGGMCRRHWRESQTENGGAHEGGGNPNCDSNRGGKHANKGPENNKPLHSYESASDTEDDDKSYESSEEVLRSRPKRTNAAEQHPEISKRNSSRSSRFQGSLKEAPECTFDNIDESGGTKSEAANEAEMDMDAGEENLQSERDVLESPPKSASTSRGEQKSPAARHSTPRRRIKTKQPVYDDESYSASGSDLSVSEADTEDEEDELKLERIMASRTESRRKWREICQNMNTSEIENGSRWHQDDADDGAKDDDSEERFLVKWSDLSYLHCSWEKEEDLLSLLKRPKPYLNTFHRKSRNGLLFDEDERGDGEYFDAAFVQIERILEITDPELPKEHVNRRLELDHSKGESQEEEFGIILDKDHPDYEDGTGRQFLVKWKNMPYTECTYEFERDLLLNDVEYKEYVDAFHSRSKKPSEKEIKLALKKQEEQSRRLYTVFGDKAKLTARMKESKIQDYQTKLEEEEFLNGGKLRDYQAEGVSWLVSNYVNNRSSVLADEMGLGKTVQVAAFVHLLAAKSSIRGPFLIIAPLSTIPHWLREFSAWTRLNTIVYHGSAEDREVIREYEMAFEADRPHNPANKKNYLKKCLPSKTKGPKPAAKWQQTWMAQVVLTTPEMLVTEDFSELTAVKWEVLVLDEAHRIKNHSSKVASNLREDRFRFNHKILMTGTPIQNNMNELWSILHMVDPDRFDDVDSFIERYGNMKSKETIDELHEIIRPYILRRLKEDVETSVPPKEETVIEVELTVLQKQYYRALYEKNVQFLHKGRKRALDRPSLANLGMQLRKCCNHPFLLRGVEDEFRKTSASSDHEGDFLVKASGKLVLLDKLLPKLKENGHRVLIFSQFKIMLDIIEDYLNQRLMKCERIDGSITGRKRQMAIDRFQAEASDGKEASFVMLLSTRAGGVGINLTAADTCIIFDSDWNPQNDLQAQARCHRIGQTKNVKVYRLLARKTFEMKMFHMSSLKMGLDQAVLQGLEGGSFGGEATMTKDEVEKLLRHGAYDIFNEEKTGSSEKESNEFESLDIDSIMAQRSKTVVYDNTGSNSSAAGGTFSKASFKAVNDLGEGEGVAEDVDIDDPEFWSKIVGEGKVEDQHTDLVGKKRKRTRVVAYSEKDYDKRLNTSLGSDNEQMAANGEDAGDDSSVSSADIDSGTDDDLTEQLADLKEKSDVPSEEKKSNPRLDSTAGSGKKGKTPRSGGKSKRKSSWPKKYLRPVSGITVQRNEDSSFGIQLVESVMGNTRKFLVVKTTKDLVLGDEVVSVNDKDVRGPQWTLDLIVKEIRDTKPGQPLLLDVLRPTSTSEALPKSDSTCSNPPFNFASNVFPARVDANVDSVSPCPHFIGPQQPSFVPAISTKLPYNANGAYAPVYTPFHGLIYPASTQVVPTPTPVAPTPVSVNRTSAPVAPTPPQELETASTNHNSLTASDNKNAKGIIVTYRVSLHRNESHPSLGIDFASQSGKHIVHEIRTGGAAAADGRLRVGDELTSVNGRNVVCADWKTVLQVIHETKQGKALILEVIRQQEDLPPFLRSQNGTLLRGITVERDIATSSFGIQMSGRDGNTSLQAFVHALIDSGPAVKEGTLRIGDEIISVNGKDVTSPTSWKFEDILDEVRNTPPDQPVCLDVFRRESSSGGATTSLPPQKHAATSPHTLSSAKVSGNDKPVVSVPSLEVPPIIANTVQPLNQGAEPTDGRSLLRGIAIQRDVTTSSFGLNLAGLDEKGTFVSGIQEGGPAAKEGTLRIGDQVTSVNGKNVIGWTFENILEEVRNTPSDQPVILDIKRGVALRSANSMPKEASPQTCLKSVESLTRNKNPAAAESLPQAPPETVDATQHQSKKSTSDGRTLVQGITIPRDVAKSSFGINLTGREGKQAIIHGIIDGGPAAKEGTLRVDDEVVTVNGKKVTGPTWYFEDILNEVRNTPLGQALVLDILRGGSGESAGIGAPVAPTGIKQAVSSTTGIGAPLALKSTLHFTPSKHALYSNKARKLSDGSVIPAKKPKQSQSGLYQKPAGRTRIGMEWDAVRGLWVPVSSFLSPDERNAGKQKDGLAPSGRSAIAAKEPTKEIKKKSSGLIARPAGRAPKGMEWDGVRGVWEPLSKTLVRSVTPVSSSRPSKKRSVDITESAVKTKRAVSSPKRAKWGRPSCRIEGCEKFSQSLSGGMCRRHWTEWTKETSTRGKKHISTRVAKDFEGTLFFGTITEYRSDDEDGEAYWHVKYDDGDEEDFDVEDLANALVLYKENEEKESDPSSYGSSSPQKLGLQR